MSHQEVRIARCAGERNLASAIEDYINKDFMLLQVVFCGMGALDNDSKLEMIRERHTIVPMFIAVFSKYDS